LLVESFITAIQFKVPDALEVLRDSRVRLRHRHAGRDEDQDDDE
jgi:hypothetical protein